MVNIKQARATANLRMLEFVARKLGPLNNEVIYLGGCTTALFITDPLSLDVRPTKDVDCIVDIVAITKLTQSNEYLFWLPASRSLQLNDKIFLVGQDGWADARLGNYHDSRVVLNDSKMIGDLFQEKLLGRYQLLGKMQHLADYDAE